MQNASHIREIFVINSIGGSMKLKEINIKKFKLDKATVTDIVRASLIAVIISLIAVLILGIIMKFVDIGNAVLLPVNQVIKVLSVLFGCILGIKCKTRGALKGLIVGLIYTLASILIFWIVNGTLTGNFGLLDAVSGLIVGAVSGIIAVNTGKSKI